MADVHEGITVIIRSMGRASLRAALESVALQSVPELDVVIVAAAGALEQPEVPGLRLRVVGQGRRWPRSEAAALGLSAVRTRWASFLDDDDLLLPGHLQKLLVALQGESGAVLAHTGVELVRASPPPMDSTGQGAEGSPLAPAAPQVMDAAFEPWLLLLGNRLPIHAVLFDVQRVREGGAAFDTSFDLYEDWDFWLQLSQLGAFVHVPGVSARYLIHESSGVHQLGFGDTTHWRVWRKWWDRAPQAWWAQALAAAAALPGAHAELKAVQGALKGARDEAWQLQRDIDIERFAVHQAQVQLKATQEHASNLALHLENERAAVLSLRAEALSLRSDLDVQKAATAAAQARADTEAEARAALEVSLRQRDEALAAQRLVALRTADELQAVLQSSSWRLTVPLRSALDRLRRARIWVAAQRRRGAWRRVASSPGQAAAYAAWQAGPEAEDRRRRAESSAAAPSLTVSLLMPVYNPDLAALDAAIASVQAQTHASWELCIADDASTAPGVRERLRALAAADPRVRVLERAVNGHISAASNSALALASGEWVGLLDQDDVLAPDALAEVARAVARHPEAGMVYSDEDKLDARGERFEPYFKPAFSIELLRGQNLVSHFGAYRRSLVQEVGGFREGYEGSQDHDLALRCAERLQPSQVLHIPRVLYHWRVAAGSTAGGGDRKPYAAEAARRAVDDHLSRTEPGSVAETLSPWGILRVRYRLPAELPRVLVWLAGSPQDPGATAWCDALRAATDYPRLELRWTAAPCTASLAALLREAPRIEAPLALLLRPGLLPQGGGWLHELVSHACRDGVGVVGGRIDRPAGDLADGPLLLDGTVAWRGTPRRSGGPFGRAVLAQAVSAVSDAMMLVRCEALDLPALSIDSAEVSVTSRHLCAAARRAGWRVVWTPFARAVDGPARDPVAGDAVAAPVDDPTFNPNLCIRRGAWVPGDQAAPGEARSGF